MDKLKVCLLSDSATLPTRKNSNDAGLDLYADFYYKNPAGDYIPIPNRNTVEIDMPPNSVIIVGTGVCVEIPEGFFGLIANKSSSDFLIGGGIVDEGYQGELLVKIFNPLDKPLTLTHGQKIAQFLLIPIITPKVVQVSEKEIYTKKSKRGKDGGIARQSGAVDIEDQYNYAFDEDPHHYNDIPDDADYMEWRSNQGDMGDWYDGEDYEEDYNYFQDDLNFDANRENTYFSGSKYFRD